MKRLHRALCGVSIAVVAVVPMGCETMSEHPTRTGAATGAVVGAGAGALIDSDRPWRGALIGAAAGGAIGAGVGHMIRRQRESFERIEQLEVQEQTVIVPTGTAEAPSQQEYPALMLRVSSDVLFAAGSSTLSPAGASKIREIAEVMREYPQSDALIRGYTSSEGGDQLNFELSERRAQIVKNELVANGVAPARLTAQGMGSAHPIATNETPEGRAQNRRVEIHVIPRESA